jgi:subtilase family serine protease
MRPLHKHFLVLLALTSLAASSAVAQRSASKALIREKVDDNQLTMLRGNTPPAANAQNDKGRVGGNMPMTDMILVLRRSPEVQAAFDAFVESQYDASSPNFHHWLTPDQVGEKFGPAQADIATVNAWLSGHGLSVDEVSKDRMTIRFSGSARQVEAIFHTELHNLMVKGESHFSNMSDPQIPMALEPVVLGPKALHNFVPKPLHRTGGKAALNPETGKWQKLANPGAAPAISVPKANAAFNGARPEIVFSCTGTGCLEEDVTPYDFAAIYNLSPLWSAGIDGNGQTIAIAGRSDVRASDVSSFRNTFGLSGGSYTQINNGADPGNCTAPKYTSTIFCTLDDQIENALDVEWAGATAPKAAVKLVVTKQTASNDAIYLSAKYAIDNKVAKIINVSYGLCELYEGSSGNSAYNSLWQTAESAGISVFVATGDSGSPGCDQGAASQGPYGAQSGLAVSGISSTSHNTAVGGTDLNWDTASTYWNTSSDSHGATAKGYIPEIPWNDTCTNPVEDAFINSFFSTTDSASTICNKIANGAITSSGNAQGVLNLVNTVGAGGGKSNCTTSDGSNSSSCGGGYTKPSWQTGVSGIPNDSKRDVPDISFFAGNGFLNSAYLVCVSDWGTCVTSAGAGSEPAVGEIGGTSAASPAMAGIMALINQKAGSAQGNPNSVLYTLAAANSGDFHDITTGTISMPCSAGSPDCAVAAAGDTYGILNGFDAGAGYDLATGLGSMNVANVANHWSAAAPTATFTLSASAATPASFAAGGTATSNITVSSADGYAGTVTLSCAVTSAPANAVEAPTCDASTGQSTVTLSATTTSGTGQVTVSSTPAPIGAVKVASNGTGWFKAAGGTALASFLLFFLPGWSRKSRNLFCTMLAILAASFFAVGCGGGGGGSNGGTGGTTKTTPTVTVTPASTSIKETDSLGVTITVAGSSGTPSGSVTMSSGNYSSGPITLDSTGKAAITIPGGKLTPPTAALGVTYSGDTKFNTAGGTANVTVAKAPTTPGAYTFTVTGTGNDSAHYAASTTFTVTVN